MVSSSYPTLTNVGPDTSEGALPVASPVPPLLVASALPQPPAINNVVPLHTGSPLGPPHPTPPNVVPLRPPGGGWVPRVIDGGLGPSGSAAPPSPAPPAAAAPAAGGSLGTVFILGAGAFALGLGVGYVVRNLRLPDPQTGELLPSFGELFDQRVDRLFGVDPASIARKIDEIVAPAIARRRIEQAPAAVQNLRGITHVLTEARAGGIYDLDEVDSYLRQVVEHSSIYQGLGGEAYFTDAEADSVIETLQLYSDIHRLDAIASTLGVAGERIENGELLDAEWLRDQFNTLEILSNRIHSRLGGDPIFDREARATVQSQFNAAIETNVYNIAIQDLEGLMASAVNGYFPDFNQFNSFLNEIELKSKLLEGYGIDTGFSSETRASVMSSFEGWREAYEMQAAYIDGINSIVADTSHGLYPDPDELAQYLNGALELSRAMEDLGAPGFLDSGTVEELLRRVRDGGSQPFRPPPPPQSAPITGDPGPTRGANDGDANPADKEPERGAKVELPLGVPEIDPRPGDQLWQTRQEEPITPGNEPGQEEAEAPPGEEEGVGPIAQNDPPTEEPAEKQHEAPPTTDDPERDAAPTVREQGLGLNPREIDRKAFRAEVEKVLGYSIDDTRLEVLYQLAKPPDHFTERVNPALARGLIEEALNRARNSGEEIYFLTAHCPANPGGGNMVMGAEGLNSLMRELAGLDDDLTEKVEERGGWVALAPGRGTEVHIIIGGISEEQVKQTVEDWRKQGEGLIRERYGHYISPVTGEIVDLTAIDHPKGQEGNGFGLPILISEPIRLGQVEQKVSQLLQATDNDIQKQQNELFRIEAAATETTGSLRGEDLAQLKELQAQAVAEWLKLLEESDELAQGLIPCYNIRREFIERFTALWQMDTEITEREATEHRTELQTAARTIFDQLHRTFDPLTGVYAPGQYASILAAVQAQLGANPRLQAFLVELDVGNIGGGNRAIGREGMDLVLGHPELFLLRVIMGRMKDNNISGIPIPIRLGGDEFGIIVVGENLIAEGSSAQQFTDQQLINLENLPQAIQEAVGETVEEIERLNTLEVVSGSVATLGDTPNPKHEGQFGVGLYIVGQEIPPNSIDPREETGRLIELIKRGNGVHEDPLLEEVEE